MNFTTSFDVRIWKCYFKVWNNFLCGGICVTNSSKSFFVSYIYGILVVDIDYCNKTYGFMEMFI